MCRQAVGLSFHTITQAKNENGQLNFDSTRTENRQTPRGCLATHPPTLTSHQRTSTPTRMDFEITRDMIVVENDDPRGTT